MDSHQNSLPNAIDLSHHLSELSKNRRFSPLKSFTKYMFDPAQRSLAGGLPNPSYFPFETISASTLSPSIYAPAGVKPKSTNWLSTLFGNSLRFIETPKYAKTPNQLQLATGLQYGAATGFKALHDFLVEWTNALTPPAYANWEVLLCDGSTDGFHKIVELLCEKGDGILVESFTYPSALETGWPMGVHPVIVDIDDFGLVPDALEEVLENWDVEARGGMRRPRVLYTIPIGQNPTGSTLPEERREAIYKLAHRFDFIIVEDDPYHSLNFGLYGHPAPGSDIENDLSKSEADRNATFLKEIGKSYLKLDYEGRVIRIDTFSKTIAPGCRLGWLTSNPLFSERLLRASETSTQQPSGPVQVLVTELVVNTWGMAGWIRWLRGLRGEYGRRRDWMVSELIKGFDIDVSANTNSLVATGATAPRRLEAYLKTSEETTWNEKTAVYGHNVKGKKILSFLPPTAGMFVWVTIHLDAYKSLEGMDVSSPAYKQEARQIMARLWTELAENKILVAPGWMFAGDGLRSGAPDEDAFRSSTTTAFISEVHDDHVIPGQLTAGEDERSLAFFRLAFATLEEKPLRETMRDFAVVVKTFFA